MFMIFKFLVIEFMVAKVKKQRFFLCKNIAIGCKHLAKKSR
jgi:hypothetical protein